jgi:cobalamin-dependent methionine synthase I
LTKKRISCGYSDFSIKYQKKFYKILNLKKLGISITKDYMLVPEKSAIAVLGIKEK